LRSTSGYFHIIYVICLQRCWRFGRSLGFEFSTSRTRALTVRLLDFWNT